jgi:2-keto-4-pentenoate hydratase/2-oxohepta-3-ene-1,7-dioic acid hydratase in catechol pathway
MKLLRYGPAGSERPAVIPTGSDELRDASSVTADFDVEFFADGGLERLAAALEAGSLPVIDLDGQRIGSPLKRPGKIVCIGLNYRDHAREAGMDEPTEPVVFMKAPNTVVGPFDEVKIPRASNKTDWEVELGVIIGQRVSYLDSPADAASHIAGYVVVNDVSEREFQLERGGQWDKGKSCDTFNPMGPWLVTRDEVADVQALDLWTDIDGERVQSGTTADMIFPVDHIVWYLSQFMVLEPGDLINTGTPAGVGSGFTPQRFLREGQTMTVGIAGLGEQLCTTIATPTDSA